MFMNLGQGVTEKKERTKDRSSRPEVFCRKRVLKNFSNFTEKHLCQNLFFNKVAGLRPATLLKKRLWHRCFLLILRIFKNAFFHRIPPVAASEQIRKVESRMKES